MHITKELLFCRYVGLIDPNPAWIREAHAIHPLSCVQQEYSIIVRDIEQDLMPLCAELNIGLVAFSPLARKLFHQADSKVLMRNHRLITALDSMAASKGVGVTDIQVALAWVYAQCKRLGVKVVAIPGTSNINHARQNITALQIRLSDADMELITLSPDEMGGEKAEEKAPSGPPPAFGR